MSLKPSFRSLPVFLTGCLLAISFTIVNCQKAPNRNGVKARPSALTEGQQKQQADAAAADSATKQQLAATKACGDDLKNDHKKMTELRDVKKLWSISALKKSEAEIENIRKLRSEFLSLCVTADKALNEFEEKSCIKDMEIEAKHKEKKNDQEKVKNTIGLVQITLACQKILADCEKEHTKVKCETSNYTPSKVTDGNRVAGGATAPAKSNAENLKKFFAKNLLMSDAMKEMSSGIGFTKYAYKGKIYTNSEKNARELADRKEVLCSIGGSNVKMIEKEMSMVIKAVSFEAVQKTSPNPTVSAQDWDLRLVDGFEGESVSILFTRVKDESETDDSDYGPALNIVCLNLNKEKMIEKDFRDAFGLLLKDLTDAELNKLKEANKAKRSKPAAPAAKPDAPKPDAPAKPGVVVADADKAKQDLAQAKRDLEAAEGKDGKLKKLEGELVTARIAAQKASDELKGQPDKIKTAEKAVETVEGELKAITDATQAAEKAKKEQELVAKKAALKIEQEKLGSLTKDVAAKNIAVQEKILEIAKEKKVIADLKVKENGLAIKVAGSETPELKTKKDAAAQAVSSATAEISKEEGILARLKEAAGIKPEEKKDDKKDDKAGESAELKAAREAAETAKAAVTTKNQAVATKKSEMDTANAAVVALREARKAIETTGKTQTPEKMNEEIEAFLLLQDKIVAHLTARKEAAEALAKSVETGVAYNTAKGTVASAEDKVSIADSKTAVSTAETELKTAIEVRAGHIKKFKPAAGDGAQPKCGDKDLSADQVKSLGCNKAAGAARLESAELAAAKKKQASAKDLMDNYKRQVDKHSRTDADELAAYRSLKPESSEDEKIQATLAIHETRVVLEDRKLSLAEQTVEFLKASIELAELEKKDSTQEKSKLAEAAKAVELAEREKISAIAKLVETREMKGDKGTKFLCRGWINLTEYDSELLQCKPAAK